jgi:hypothetical protein
MLPDVPTLTSIVAPQRISSSTAIAAEGQPMPVDVTDTGAPFQSPV